MSKVDAIKARLAARNKDSRGYLYTETPAISDFNQHAPDDMRYLLSIADALAKLDVDSLSPLEALTKLYELKRLVR